MNKENIKFLEKNWFKVGVLLALGFISYMIYMAVVVAPKKLLNTKQMQTANLQACLDEADTKEKSDILWYSNFYTQKYGKNWINEYANTLAFNTNVETAKSETQQNKSECYKKYPQS